MKIIATVIRLLFFGLFIILLANGKMMLWLGLFVVSLVAAVFFGRIYCGYVCPMNTLMVPVEWIAKKIKMQTESTPKLLGKGHFPWLFLGLSVAAMLVVKKRFDVNLPIFPIWLTISVLVTLRYQPKVFHNLVCPFGVLQRIIGRFAKVAKKVDPTACIGCKRCEKSCPSGAITVTGDDRKAVINPALCHQCVNCQEACPENAIYIDNYRP